MYEMVLNMPLNEIWNRKKKEQLISRLENMVIFFQWFQAGYAHRRYTYKKNMYCKITLVNVTAWDIWKMFFGICPEIPKISPIKLSSAEFNRHYLDIAEFQIKALIIKSSELSVHAALAKIYFSNVFPRALCFAWKEAKAAVNYMRVEEKLWEQGCYFAISAAVFDNVINTIASSKCGLRNVIRFKEQLNKKELFARAFSLYYMQMGAEKLKDPG